jgi:hypothetical protein
MRKFFPLVVAIVVVLRVPILERGEPFDGSDASGNAGPGMATPIEVSYVKRQRRGRFGIEGLGGRTRRLFDKLFGTAAVATAMQTVPPKTGIWPCSLVDAPMMLPPRMARSWMPAFQ